MLDSPQVIATLIGAVVGVLLGVIVSELKEWWWRTRRRKAHWRALSAEVEICREMAEIFLRDGVGAPLYRLPTLSYLNSFPALLESGATTERDTRAVTQFYNQVESLNRGLDQANDARSDAQTLNGEYSRNRLKAENLVGAVSYYSSVRQVLDRCAD